MVANVPKPAIAVPPHLYLLKSNSDPLVDVKTAWIWLMQQQQQQEAMHGLSFKGSTHSSEYFDHLIRNGAVVIGKTKMSAFAVPEVPPTRCFDHFPGLAIPVASDW